MRDEATEAADWRGQLEGADRAPKDGGKCELSRARRCSAVAIGLSAVCIGDRRYGACHSHRAGDDGDSGARHDRRLGGALFAGWRSMRQSPPPSRAALALADMAAGQRCRAGAKSRLSTSSRLASSQKAAGRGDHQRRLTCAARARGGVGLSLPAQRSDADALIALEGKGTTQLLGLVADPGIRFPL